MDRSTLVLFCLALSVGFALQFVRSKVFQGELVEQETNVSKGLVEVPEDESIDPRLVAAMAAMVSKKEASPAASPPSRINVSAGAKREELRDSAQMRRVLDGAQTLQERREAMKNFVPGQLSDRSSEALEENILFLREEIEFISGRYISEFDSVEFNSYFIDLMKQAYDHQYELNSRASKPTLVVDKLLDGNIHNEIRAKIIQYINVGSQDRVN